MPTVVLGLSKLTTGEKTQLGRRVSKDLNGNPFFPNPQPTPAEITTAVEAVENAQTMAAGGSKEAMLQLQTQVKQLETILSQAAKYVEFVSNGDESKIISAGMEVKAKATPIGPMSKPTDFKIGYTESAGEFACSIQPMKGAFSYIFQYTTTPEKENSWENGAISTKARAIVSGLSSGTKYFFRCAAIGSAGQGPWSDVIQRFAQ